MSSDHVYAAVLHVLLSWCIVSQMEEQKMQHHAISAEETAKKKVNKVRSEMESQLKGFVDQQEKNLLHASLVEMHSDDVDKVLLFTSQLLVPCFMKCATRCLSLFAVSCIIIIGNMKLRFFVQVCMVINSALGAGLSWDDIAAMVATETAAGKFYLYTRLLSHVLSMCLLSIELVSDCDIVYQNIIYCVSKGIPSHLSFLN